VAGFHEAEVRRRLEEKNREERAQAKLLIGMGIPFAGAALFGLTFVLSFLLWALSLPYWAALLISFVVVAAVLTIDTWRHPSEPGAPTPPPACSRSPRPTGSSRESPSGGATRIP
jgi:cobalamin biosynthesis protein CobD/CbiB